LPSKSYYDAIRKLLLTTVDPAECRTHLKEKMPHIQIIDIDTLSPEQRKFLLMILATSDLWFQVFQECNPTWIPILQEKTHAYLVEIFALPESSQHELKQNYLTVDENSVEK